MWTKEEMWTRRDRVLVKQVALTCVYLLLVFLAILSYFYGSLFHSSDRAHNLKVLAIDYDGSEIGKALQAAYNRVQAPDFITLDYQPASDYPDIDSLSTSAICSQGYWGVIYTHPGATQRLQAAISGNNQNTPYNSSDAITFIYSGVRYPVISEAFIGAELQALVSTTTSTFHAMFGGNLFQTANGKNNAAGIAALLEPIRATSIVLYPAEQGTRVLLNTITMVAPPLMQFFFVMALDHISVAVTVFSRWPIHRVYVTRLLGGKVFSFFGAMTVTACIYAFRETWLITGAQFMKTWLGFWFYMEVSYVIMDTLIGTVVPLRYVPFFVFTWVILNVTSTLFPFELNPGFYKWGYFLPAHNVWLLLMQIWSDGCYSKIEVALPVLFMWWFIGHITSAATVWRKCNTARKTGDDAAVGVPPQAIPEVVETNDGEDSDAKTEKDSEKGETGRGGLEKEVDKVEKEEKTEVEETKDERNATKGEDGPVTEIMDKDELSD